MAEVFKAKTVGVEGFEKVVAIKRILPAVAEDQEFIGMFVDEAKITAALSHANLAQTFDLGRIDDTYFIAMEYVAGKDLRAVFERLKRRGEKLPVRLAAWILACVCEGLDYAHKKKDAQGAPLHIVHRDVSPQNVIVSFEGEVKLIDFGIAKAANKITRTQSGILKGKFGYMSPEQVRGLPLDHRTDIFAAGIVLYELCTGERLFTGTSDFNVLEKVENARVPPPSKAEPSIPAQLEQIILRALTREPADRYQQAGELAADLRLFLGGPAPQAAARDELARFMRATFPDENAREHPPHADADATRPGAREATGARSSATTAGGPATPTPPRPAGGPGTAGSPDTAAGAGTPDASPNAPEEGPSTASPEPGPRTFPGLKGLIALCVALAVCAAVAAAHARRASPAGSASPGASLASPPAARPEATSPPSAEAPAPGTLGFLSLGSRPPARVFVDGADTGRSTPLASWPLKPGSHRVRLVAGDRTRELGVQIEPERTLSQIVDLRGR